MPGKCERECLTHIARTVGLVAAYAVAISSTVLRLGLRYRRRQLYWDDFWALFALIAAVILLALFICICFVAISELSFFIFLALNIKSNYIIRSEETSFCSVLRLLGCSFSQADSDVVS